MKHALKLWVERQLAAPKAEGEGRNNQMIQVMPRMLELGLDEETIFRCFKEIYELEDDTSKDAEIEGVIRNARKYARTRTAGAHIFLASTRRLTAIRDEAGRKLSGIFKSFSWSAKEMRQLTWCKLPPQEQRSVFLKTLFGPQEIIWSGDKFDSGRPHHARHFRPAGAWTNEKRAFPFLSHCTFHLGAHSRSNEWVRERRYMVIESDELSHDEILAVFRWLHDSEGIPLRAAVFSGKRSIHGWFDWPSNDPRELAALIEGLRCDPATLRPSQPVRLAGARRRETGLVQDLLFLAQ